MLTDGVHNYRQLDNYRFNGSHHSKTPPQNKQQRWNGGVGCGGEKKENTFHQTFYVALYLV